jgi:hypothetical protein
VQLYAFAWIYNSAPGVVFPGAAGCETIRVMSESIAIRTGLLAGIRRRRPEFEAAGERAEKLRTLPTETVPTLRAETVPTLRASCCYQAARHLPISFGPFTGY